jgi:RND family efflux transporter MFP subunit
MMSLRHFQLAILALVVIGLGCRRMMKLPPPPPASVTVAKPIVREVLEWDEFPGHLEATRKVEVRARVSGYLTSVNFQEGSIVNKGDLLFEIDPRPFQAELDRAQGEVARAKARLALTETEYKRTQSIVPSGAASQLELDEKQANLDEAKANVSVMQAAVKTAQYNVEWTQIRAEITGRISKFNITPGNLVTGGESNATLLTTITSLDPIYCYVDADERSVMKYAKLAREGKRISARDSKIPAKLALLSDTVFDHVGLIDFVNNEIDPQTGTLAARGVFANPKGAMTPGMFARLRVPGAAPYKAMLVAEEAIQTDQGGKYLLVVDAQNTVHIRPVVLGTSFGPLRAIESGLTGDEHIIVNGMMKVRPEAKVNPKVGEMPGADVAESLATTQVVVPDMPTTGPAMTQPSTQPTTAPSPGFGSASSSGRLLIGVGAVGEVAQ